MVCLNMSRLTWRQWAAALKTNTYALYLAAKHPRVSLPVKLFIGVIVAYALSPIDLIPDFIPVLGYLDDLILLPVGIWLVIKLIPAEVWCECTKQAQTKVADLPRNRRAMYVIILIWILSLLGVVIWLWKIARGN